MSVVRNQPTVHVNELESELCAALTTKKKEIRVFIIKGTTQC